ncbi:FAD-dependent oxidoreductase [Streptomyces sp. NPDC051567]|uniref:hydroxysqualene dehydroxylase n=1 Tax=Streptomyces sp. NPDC051567 TaxID=3365660 RepID=UPI0037ABB672
MRGRRVAVLGGGVSGLTAAMELAERGFEVTVVEAGALGGKARSMPVPGTGRDGRRDLPGEHGFRFFPGFYRNLPVTMSRIPFPGNPDGVGVAGNLVETSEVLHARGDGRDGLVLDVSGDGREPDLEETLRSLGAFLSQARGLSAAESEYFANRLLVYATSGDERRAGQWEHTSWWEFSGARGASEEYYRLCVIGPSRSLVAAKAEVASAESIARTQTEFWYGLLGRKRYAAADRVLNAPTNEAWIDPWVRHLKGLGVRFALGRRAVKLELTRGEVSAVLLGRADGTTDRWEADWFVCAVPAERAVKLLDAEVLARDPALGGAARLETDWMTGLQFYLRHRTPIAHGHVIYLDSPWALTSVSQAQFWAGVDFAATYGDGEVQDCLSVDISAWDVPGPLFGKAAWDCTRKEVAAEVWHQMCQALNREGETVLSEKLLHSWFLDPAVTGLDGPGRARNSEPLLISTAGSAQHRPRAATALPNLFLAGDWVHSDLNLATMEAADQTGKAAANALLTAAAVRDAVPCEILTMQHPPELAELHRIDARLYAAGLPNMFDRPAPWATGSGQPAGNASPAG